MWYPAGPDFVAYSHMDRIAGLPFRRISRNDEADDEGRVLQVVFEPNASGSSPAWTYAVAGEDVVDSERDVGAVVFRRRAQEEQWVSITDELRRPSPAIDPNCVAVHPREPGTLFLGTWGDSSVYRSIARGDPGTPWERLKRLPGRIRKIVVDPGVASVGVNTRLYAATDAGLYVSPDSGGNWPMIIPGDVLSFVLAADAAGQTHLYASIRGSGIWYNSGDPLNAADWDNLTARGIGPSVPAGAIVLVDCCPTNPRCAYAWCAEAGLTTGLFNTTDPHRAWNVVNPHPVVPDGTYALDPYGGERNFTFAIAPNSPGDGVRDILFFGALHSARSTNGGRTWQVVVHHDDIITIGFFPSALDRRDRIPAVYIGSDGGLVSHDQLCDPTFVYDAHPPLSDYQGDFELSASPTLRNENRGLPNGLIYAIAAPASGPAPHYIGCVDTGIARSQGERGWRLRAGGDALSLAASRTRAGQIRLWEKHFDGRYHRVRVLTESEDRYPSASTISVRGAPGLFSEATPGAVPTVDAEGRCLYFGGIPRTVAHTMGMIPRTYPNDVLVRVDSTRDIHQGDFVIFGDSEMGPPEDRWGWTSPVREVNVIAGTILVQGPTRNAPDHLKVSVVATAVMRATEDGVADPISQDFVDPLYSFGRRIVAPNQTPDGPIALLYGTRDVWVVDAPATETGSPSWTQSPPLPADAGWIGCLPHGEVLAMLLVTVPDGVPGGGDTPLVLLPRNGAAWEAQVCVGLPSGSLADGSPQPFGKFVFDPRSPDVLFAIHGSEVFRVARDTATSPVAWRWSRVADGLPGVWITDLWVGDVRSPQTAPPEVILRAGLRSRGVWETHVSGKPEPAGPSLYLRRNLLDHGWTEECPDDEAHPYDPAIRVWHYECADAKIEMPQSNPADPAHRVFYQTDPDGTGVAFSTDQTIIGPISAVLFDLVRDEPGSVPAGEASRLHVQVRNRSLSAADGVYVWALCAPANAGAPALNSRRPPNLDDPPPPPFDGFWDQFLPDGSIVPNLPPDSQWQAVGDPIRLDPISAASPRVASWRWVAPELPIPAADPPTNDLGHYCIAIFIHSADRRVGERTSLDIDEIAHRNRQVGQKNVHLVQPRMSRTLRDIDRGSPEGDDGSFRLYLEFHNPTASRRRATVVANLAQLPKHQTLNVHLRASAGASIRPASRHLMRRIFDIFLRMWKRESARRGSGELIWRGGSNGPVAGVDLSPGSYVGATIVAPTGLPAGLSFSIQQEVEGSIVGGSTFLTRSHHVDSRQPFPLLPLGEEGREERGSSKPAWIEYIDASSIAKSS